MDMAINNFPFEIKDVEQETAEHLMKYFTGELTGFVRVGHKGYFLPQKYKQEASNIYNMEIRPTDVFVTSYPRSGTTWTQELVWMVANDLDYEGSDAVSLAERFPYLEFSILIHPVMEKRFYMSNIDSEENIRIIGFVSQSIEQLTLMSTRRFIKSHLPLSLLSPNLLDTAKVVYVARDPRDVAVSFYHLNRIMTTQGYVGDFKRFWKFFISDLYYWLPYFEHLKESWEKRHHPNLLFLFYEELSEDLPAAVTRVADFFGKTFSSDQIRNLCEHLSIESFKNNKSLNYDVMKDIGILTSVEQPFIRKGITGGWRDYFDEQMTQEADKWIAENLRGSDFRFPHLQQ